MAEQERHIKEPPTTGVPRTERRLTEEEKERVRRAAEQPNEWREPNP
ncbi:MAG: hypothetical protein HY395_00190 [Candidatus Doudnabacteria bacterium]|nr:hypothetical protein [Candidatus Doudnabacteria bacterium]